MALGLGWAFVRYACCVFFSASDMDLCFDEVVVWWWWKGRERKGRRGNRRNRRGKEKEREKEKEKEEGAEWGGYR